MLQTDRWFRPIICKQCSMLSYATRLRCAAVYSPTCSGFDGELLHLEASSSLMPKFLQMLQKRYAMPPDVSQVSGRVVLQ